LHSAISKVRDQIDKALEKNSHDEAIKFLDFKKKLEEVIQKDDKVDNWFTKNIGNLMLYPFTFALVLIVASFIDFSW
jgi:hypothetical protein